MKVRFVKERFIVDRTHKPGDVVELPNESGKRIVAGGFAIIYREEEQAEVRHDLKTTEKVTRRK